MLKKIIVIVAVLVVITVGIVAYSVFRSPEAASGPIEAIPLQVNTEETTEIEEAEASAQTDVVISETEPETVEEAKPVVEANVAEMGTEAEVETATDETGVAETEAAASEEMSEAGAETASSPVIFEIIPAETEARFIINEVLRGEPTTVVGVTNQTAGQFAVDPADLSTAQVGVIQVNARTLATDNDFRNRAIKNWILMTNEYEFITFSPTEVVSLPEAGAVGETYTFQVVGDLTVRNVTRPVTFEVTATPVGETRIEGLASTIILYQDFELAIPDAPAVDTVEDEVRLEIEFVAEAG